MVTLAGPSGATVFVVPVDSALGRHADAARTLDFPPAHRFIAFGHSHLDLLSSKVVYAQFVAWLRPDSPAARGPG